MGASRLRVAIVADNSDEGVDEEPSSSDSSPETFKCLSHRGPENFVRFDNFAKVECDITIFTNLKLSFLVVGGFDCLFVFVFYIYINIYIFFFFYYYLLFLLWCNVWFLFVFLEEGWVGFKVWVGGAVCNLPLKIWRRARCYLSPVWWQSCSYEIQTRYASTYSGNCGERKTDELGFGLEP